MVFALVLALTIGCIAFILAWAGHGSPRPDSLRGRIQARGWGLLLLPVAMAAAEMAGGAHGLIPAELGLAILAIVFAPKLAAKLVPYGVLGLAVFGVHLAKLYRDGITSRVQYLFFHAGPAGQGHPALATAEAGVLFVVGLWLLVRVDAPGAGLVRLLAEALANVTKHAGARSVRIQLSQASGLLRAQVTDDGCGGADSAQGTGLAGVERRLAAFDGILAVSSPPGGPTIVVIEVPCALSSLTPREREVLALMAEGRSNVAIAQRLFITEKAVSKHAAGIFDKLDLALSDDDNRRVLAVLAYLDS